jgi:hypothetical protein
MRWLVSFVVLLAVGCGGPNGIARGAKTYVLGGTIAATGIGSAVGGVATAAIAADQSQSAVGAVVLIVAGVALTAVGFGIVSMGDDEITAELAKLKGAPTVRQPPSERMPGQPPRERGPLEPAARPADRAPPGVVHPDARIEPARTSTAPARRPL